LAVLGKPQKSTLAKDLYKSGNSQIKERSATSSATMFSR